MRNFLSCVLCVLLLLTTVACSPVSPPSKPAQSSQTTQSPQESQEGYRTYDDIIIQYTELLTSKHNGEELASPNTAAMDEKEASIAEALYGIVNSRTSVEAVENLGYSFKDMDDNGTPELILLSKYTSVLAVFTVSNNIPILLEVAQENDTIIFATKKRFFITRSTTVDKIQQVTQYICRVDGNKMAYDSIFGEVYDHEQKKTIEWFQMIDDSRVLIDQELYKELNREFSKSYEFGYSRIAKLEAPYIHLPLKNHTVNESLPIADFSSYSAIRQTYKQITDCVEDFNVNNWFGGEYDNLFSFPNSLAFEYYTRLLYALHLYDENGCAGYDEVDLNGDGIDELVFLMENYGIKAIFTMKNGTPVLLDSFEDGARCWIDDKGFIHTERFWQDFQEAEYSIYEFKENGEYARISSLYYEWNYGSRYLTKDGITQKITYEELMETYYDDFFCYSYPFEENEQTKSTSILTYTSLFESTEDIVKTATSKSWHKYRNLDNLAEKDIANSNTYVTFENITDTQMHVTFTYKLTTFYPDPDRENYMLSETTESALSITVHNENGVFVFNDNGVKGKIEFGDAYLWIVFEESADSRFHEGHHCYEEYTPDTENEYIQ